ncbi:MAG: 2OG-Fe(II) oxygenase [Gammaproteobacteria bacterium]|nr:2OG-Fe(II) oxygenase [Gammaproteobacteria bacterium]
MNPATDTSEPTIFEHIVNTLVTQQYAVIDQALPSELLAKLEKHFLSLDNSQFKRAGIGRADQFHTNDDIRTDVIHWLNKDDTATADYFNWMESLRQHVNRELFLGLFDYECHYAHFPQGSYYKRHVDAFKGQGNRRLTTILYLNHDWKKSDGGDLKMYRNENDVEPFAEILPTFGRLVVFLSESFPHEVCTAHRSRRSITGWFRINNSSGRHVDPDR